MPRKREIEVIFDADVNRFGRNVDKASDDLKRFSVNANKLAGGLTRQFKVLSGAIAGAVSVGGLAYLTKSAFDTADAIGKAAERTGFGVEKLQELRFAADQTGVSISELDGSLARFTKRVGLARIGAGAANTAYKQLGIDLSQTNEQVFADVVETLASMENQTNRLALVTQIFGDDAQKLELTLRGGNAALETWATQARELGLIFDEDLVRGAEAANDQLSIMKQVLDAQFTRAFVQLAPHVISLGEAFGEAATKLALFLDQLNDIEDQGKAALQKTIKVLQQEYSTLQTELDDTIAKQAGEKGPDGVWELITGLRDPEEIRAEMAKIEREFKAAIERLNALNRGGGTTGTAARNIFTAPSDTGSAASKSSTKSTVLKFPKQEQVAAYKDPVDDFVQSLYRYREELDLINPKLERLGMLFAEGAIPVEVYKEGIKRLGFETESVFDELPEEVEKTNDAMQELGITFTSAFEDAIVEGKNLSDVLKGLEQDITRIITRKLVTEPIGNAISGALGGDGLLGDIFGGIFGGGKATGGPVYAGTPYLVGENGPELMVPRQSGTVVPNGKFGGSVVVNINAIPPGGNPEAYRLSARQGALEGSRLLNKARSIT